MQIDYQLETYVYSDKPHKPAPLEPFVRSPYNYDMDLASAQTALVCPEPSLTQQQFLEDSDINTIVNRFNLTGQLPENPQPPVYADFEGIFDFQTAQNAVVAAQRAFMEFPAHIRNRFSNDPQELLAFVDDDRNREEAERLGLLNKPSPIIPAAPDKPAPSAAPAAPLTSPST